MLWKTKHQKAKSNCWNNFLENASEKEIFKAFQYTKQNKIEKLPILQYQSENKQEKAITFQEKCNVFLKTLFIKPSETTEPSWTNYQESDNWIWPEVTRNEIKTAIFTSSIKKSSRIRCYFISNTLENLFCSWRKIL